MQPWQLDYNKPPDVLDMPKSSRVLVPMTPSTPVSDFPSLASFHSSLTPSLQNISLGRGHGRPCKQLIEPTYEGYPADGTKEEKARWLKMKATEQWRYNILTSNWATEYRESERKWVSAYNKHKKAATVTGQPKDNLQEEVDPEESVEIPDTEEKQDAAKEKSRLWYVKYVKFVATLIPEMLISVYSFFICIIL